MNSEGNIQDIIYRWVYQKGHLSITPNVYMYQWESDMISVTKAGFVHEYEIKTSKSDFKADSKKKDKWEIIKNGYRELTKGDKRQYQRPNYFWYVCPVGLITEGDIPDYAGLLYVDKYHVYHDNEKPAVRLHKEPVSQTLQQRLINSFVYKYWDMRLNWGKK